MKPWTQYAAGMSPPSAQILRVLGDGQRLVPSPEEREGVCPPGGGVEPHQWTCPD